MKAGSGSVAPAPPFKEEATQAGGESALLVLMKGCGSVVVLQPAVAGGGAGAFVRHRPHKIRI